MKESKIQSETESRKKIRTHIVESGMTGKLLRARAVEEQLTNIEDDLEARSSRLESLESGSFAREMNKKMILALIAQRKKLLREFEYTLVGLCTKAGNDKCRKTHKPDAITPDDIERARTFPIESLIDTKRGISKCVSGNHEDNHPSMDVRNNFAYCYSCGWSGDAIAVAMKVYGIDFVEAVKKLQ